MQHHLSSILNEQRPLVTGEMNETLTSAVHRMGDAGVGSILVVRDGSLVGMCTERSILQRLVADRYDPARITLGHVMAAPVLCAEPDMQVDEALQLMTRTRTRHRSTCLDLRAAVCPAHGQTHRTAGGRGDEVAARLRLAGECP